MLISASSFAQWDSYDENSQFSAYYVPSRVTVEKGVITVSNRIDYQQPQTLKGRHAPVGFYASVVETVFFDCKRKQFVVTDATYNANKESPARTVHWFSLLPDQFEWISLYKNQNKIRLFNKVKNICTS
jgi:hypothetical protein